MDKLPDNNKLPIDKIKEERDSVSFALDNATDAHTLSDMSKEFKFFTPAPLVSLSAVDMDVVAAAVQVTGATSVQIIDAEFAFFQQLPTIELSGNLVDLNSRLYMVHNTQHETLYRYLHNMAFVDPLKGIFIKAFTYCNKLLDEFHIKKSAVITSTPFVDITVFGAISEKGTHYLDFDPKYPKPALRVGPPQQATIDEFKDLLKVKKIIPGE